MPSPGEIQRRAREIHTSNDTLTGGRDRCQGYVYNSTSWWQSEPGKVLRSEYSEIQADINRLSAKVTTLENSTGRLSGNVQQADDERRRRAEEQKRLEASKKK